MNATSGASATELSISVSENEDEIFISQDGDYFAELFCDGVGYEVQIEDFKPNCNRCNGDPDGCYINSFFVSVRGNYISKYVDQAFTVTYWEASNVLPYSINDCIDLSKCKSKSCRESIDSWSINSGICFSENPMAFNSDGMVFGSETYLGLQVVFDNGDVYWAKLDGGRKFKWNVGYINGVELIPAINADDCYFICLNENNIITKLCDNEEDEPEYITKNLQLYLGVRDNTYDEMVFQYAGECCPEEITIKTSLGDYIIPAVKHPNAWYLIHDEEYGWHVVSGVGNATVHELPGYYPVYGTPGDYVESDYVSRADVYNKPTFKECASSRYSGKNWYCIEPTVTQYQYDKKNNVYTRFSISVNEY